MFSLKIQKQWSRQNARWALFTLREMINNHEEQRVNGKSSTRSVRAVRVKCELVCRVKGPKLFWLHLVLKCGKSGQLFELNVYLKADSRCALLRAKILKMHRWEKRKSSRLFQIQHSAAQAFRTFNNSMMLRMRCDPRMWSVANQSNRPVWSFGRVNGAEWSRRHFLFSSAISKNAANYV